MKFQGFEVKEFSRLESITLTQYRTPELVAVNEFAYF